MNWLTFGLAADNLLVHIDDTPPGDSGLVCPYCDAGLIAQGEAFEHAAPLCPPLLRPLRYLPVLPLSGRFDADLTRDQVRALTTLAEGGRIKRGSQRVLEQAGYVHWNDYRGYRGDWDLTKHGQVVVGTLSLLLFCELQDPKLRGPLQGFIQAAEWAVRTQRDDSAIRNALMDLRLYRAALRRRLMLTFALLELHLDGRVVYHSAVTARPVVELAAALRDHLAVQHRDVTVTVLDAWLHRGAIARYFVHRYQSHLTAVAGLADCFQFKDLTPVLRDLHRMPPKELSDAELQLVLDDDPPAIEVQILALLREHAAAERRATLRTQIQAGMQRVKAGGVHIGRPAGSAEDVAAFLAKESSERVIVALGDGLSIRKAAAAAGVAPNTALKIKRLLDEQSNA